MLWSRLAARSNSLGCPEPSPTTTTTGTWCDEVTEYLCEDVNVQAEEAQSEVGSPFVIVHAARRADVRLGNLRAVAPTSIETLGVA